MPVLERALRLPIGARSAIHWFHCPGAFERLLPPWLTSEEVRLRPARGTTDVDRDTPTIPGRYVWREGRIRWVLDREPLEDGTSLGFVDRAIAGPFDAWQHEHRFRELGPAACMLDERVTFEVPEEPTGSLLTDGDATHEVARWLRYRQRVLQDDLHAHAAFHDEPRRRICVWGGHPLLLGRLVPFLTSGGHEVVRMDAATGTDAPVARVDAAVPNEAQNDAQTEGEARPVVHLHLPTTRDAALGVRTVGTTDEAVNAAHAQDASDAAPKASLTVTPMTQRRTSETGASRDHTEVRVVHGPVLHGADLLDDVDIAHWRQALGHDGRADGLPIPWIAVEDLVGLLHTIAMTPLLPTVADVIASPPEPVRDDRLRALLHEAAHGPARTTKAVSTRLGDQGTVPAGALLLSGLEVSPNEQRGQPDQIRYRFRFSTVEEALLHEVGAADPRAPGQDLDPAPGPPEG